MMRANQLVVVLFGTSHPARAVPITYARAAFLAFALLTGVSAATASPIIIEAPNQIDLGSVATFEVNYDLIWDTPPAQPNPALTEVFSRAQFAYLYVSIDGVQVDSLYRPTPSTYSLNSAVTGIRGGTFTSTWEWVFEHTFLQPGVYEVAFEGRAYYWRDVLTHLNAAFTGGQNDYFSGVTTIRVSDNSVPIPATITLFGLGFAGLGWSRRKKA